MGFGINVKVEVPKVEVPKVDPSALAKQATSAVTGAVADAVSAVTDAANSAAAAVTGAVSSAVDAANAAAASLASVAGAIADVAVSFTGAIQDIVLEPHLQLDANASFGDTHFEQGPIWIRVEMTAVEAKSCADTLHLFSTSGGFDQSKKVSDFVDASDGSVGILFEQAPMNQDYTLELVPSSGPPRTMFRGVAYGMLRKTKQRYVQD